MEANKIYSPDALPQELQDIPAEQFEFAHKEEKLHDANFETVSPGFFSDALYRLKRNKASVAAFFILCVITFMAIVGPFMTPYSFIEQFTDFTYMPPRIPYIEKLGIFDGTSVVPNHRLDSLTDTSKFPEGCVLGYDMSRVSHQVIHGKHCQYVKAYDDNGQSVFGKLVFDFLSAL